MSASEYVLRRIFSIGKYRVDFLQRKYWFKSLGLPYIIIEKKLPNGGIQIKCYLRQRKSNDHPI